MIEIKAPRYHDRVVLVARYRLQPAQDCKIHILNGSYKGYYLIKNDDIINSPIENMVTHKSHKTISMRAVDLDKLIRLEDEV